MVDDQEELVRQIEEVLDRLRPIDALAALRRTSPDQPRDAAGDAAKTIAVGFDTNAVFKLAEKKRADIVDYFLLARHPGPVILPGQVVQEFWNNILGGIQASSELVRRKYAALADDLKKLGLDLEPFDAKFQALIDEFDESYSYTFDPATATRISTVLEAFQRTATVPYVSRSRFSAIAETRHRTRTPPGFKDVGHGDFYVWADYLLGLLGAQSRDMAFDHAVFVTEDVKIDWSLRGQAHPILVAEVEALVGVSFETWDVNRLALYVGR